MKHWFTLLGLLLVSNHLLAELPPGAENWPSECDAGTAKSCLFHGFRLMKGDQIEKNENAATHYFSKACKLKLADGCHHTGYNFFYGKGNVTTNRAKSFPYLANACKLGYYKRQTCYLAAWTVLNEKSLAQYRGDAASLAHKGCANSTDDPKACGLAAWIYSGAVEEKHLGRMENYAVRGCQLKDHFACYYAAQALAFDKDKEPDYEKANRYAKFGYKLNKNPDYAYMVGMTFVKLENYKEAQTYFEEACNAKMAAACLAIANTMLAQDESTHQAREFYKKSCSLGEQSGCTAANDLDRYHSELKAYEEQVAAYEAQQEKVAQARKKVEAALAAGDFNQALEIATYGVGSRQLAAEAILAAQRANALPRVDPIYFYATRTWFDFTNKTADAIVENEIAKIKTEEKKQQNRIRPTPVFTGPKPPGGLYEQAMKNNKETYRRNLQRYIDGGRPSDPRVYQ